MGALQKLRKQRVAARMRATMITASEHCAQSLGANIPPRMTTKPSSAPFADICKVVLVSDTLALWVSYRKFVLNWRTLSTGLVSACTAENLSNAGRDGRWKKDKSGEAGGSGLHLLLIPRLPSLLLKRNWTFCICHLDYCGWLWMMPCHKWKRCPAPEALAALQGCLLRVRARAVS